MEKTQKLTETTMSLLRSPFEPAQVNFRAQGGVVMPYTDARAVRERLNQVASAEWSTRMIPLEGGDMICELTVCGVTRSDAGEGDAFGSTSAKAAASDALKRAAFSHGIGEYLYSTPTWRVSEGPPPGMQQDFQRYWRSRYAQWLQSHGISRFGQPLGMKMQIETSAKSIRENPSYLQLRAEIKNILRETELELEDIFEIIDALDLPDEMIAWNSKTRGEFYEVLTGVLEAQHNLESVETIKEGVHD